MSPIRVEVRLFGMFRKYSSAALTFEVPRGTVVSAVRKRIAEALRAACPTFRDERLLEVSVLADEQRVLDDGDALGPRDRISLAILPPVCGG
ncbi:MAG TPA: hypothetical protein VF912_06760 [Anaeromyxobacter sp.]